ncbi:AzlC family ABC transporter permease [Xenorhabdus bovienii]|uniref:AzlC family ABC transporter permease n=1 Tax=Xenorhabdus bovienii TaxID=40576 RepID=UPI0023B2274E|nr:AzlC family ABC transporter permease [Xenorhabdus bovienii]MDE9481302.1 AzlC family ABC transporter permease [Xenorhabdus bovienii]MDE9544740.1 AzlC family ABC transporter permease [Xenorhabdus bovienii]MDE9550709.1 AzlC family ABC transporter permease [Xenorhabdus bovienii]MDE9554071.1 AzlC family ABC transporter permease [Xenorhabdus bovienii]
MVDSLPVCISFFLIFASIGALYQRHGIPLMETLVGSLLIYAAPLQVAAVGYLADGAVLSVIILALLINFRFFLMAMVMSQYFQGIPKRNILLAMLGFSASTYTVAHSHISAENIKGGKSQFTFYLGIAIPCFVITFCATLLGYVSAEYLNYESLSLFLMMLVPIHFASLTAKRAGKDMSVMATVMGGLCAPLLNEVNMKLVDLVIPVLCGVFIALFERKTRKDRSS